MGDFVLEEVTTSDVHASEVRARLVVSVTGHCDVRPQDRDALWRRVRSVFLRLKRSCPSTPFVVLSSLTEGADRLIAHVALEPEIAARLTDPLPMSDPPYEVDVHTLGSLTDFRELLRSAGILTHRPSLD